MSATLIPPAPAKPQLAKAEDAAVNAARDVPTLIVGLKAVDSPLADQLQGISLLGSKTFWAPIALMMAARYVAKGPITSVLPAAK